jgi:hypothetical protein
MSTIVFEIKMDTLNLTGHHATGCFDLQCHSGLPSVTDNKMCNGKNIKQAVSEQPPLPMGA